MAPSTVGEPQEANIEEARKTSQDFPSNIEEARSNIEKTNTEKEALSNTEKTASNLDKTTLPVSKEMPNISQGEEILLPFVSNIEEIKNALAMLMDDESPEEQSTPETWSL